MNEPKWIKNAVNCLINLGQHIILSLNLREVFSVEKCFEIQNRWNQCLDSHDNNNVNMRVFQGIEVFKSIMISKR